MTLSEIRARLIALELRMGPKSLASIDFNTGEWRRTEKHDFKLTLWPTGVLHGSEYRAEGSDINKIFDESEAALKEIIKKSRAERVEKMALEIITSLATYGACGDVRLRGREFSQSEINELGPLACARADEISQLGPFIIESAGKPNEAD